MMGSGNSVNVELTEEQKTLLTGFNEYLGANKRLPITIKRHVYCFNKFLEAAGADFNFDTASKQDLIKVFSRINTSSLAPETKRKITATIKLFYKWFKGEGEIYPKEVSWLKTTADAKIKLPEDLLSEEEVNLMINVASSIRDKAIISIMFETGCRIGELINLRVKDVEMDNNSGHLTLKGKTGMRKIPIKRSLSYLALYLDSINKSDPNKPLWLDVGTWMNKEEPIDKAAVAKVLKGAGRKAGIKKRIYPHLFRHSSATYWAQYLTEQQLKYYFGWTGGSTMAATYVHLSGRDIDHAILSSYDDGEDIIKPRSISFKTCPRCKEKNHPASIHCSRCGDSLEINEDIKNELQRDHDVDIIKNFLKKAAKNPKLFEQLYHVD